MTSTRHRPPMDSPFTFAWPLNATCHPSTECNFEAGTTTYLRPLRLHAVVYERLGGICRTRRRGPKNEKRKKASWCGVLVTNAWHGDDELKTLLRGFEGGCTSRSRLCYVVARLPCVAHTGQPTSVFAVDRYWAAGYSQTCYHAQATFFLSTSLWISRI